MDVPRRGEELCAPLLRDVPGLADAGAALDRLELVAPDPAAGELAHQSRSGRLPREPTVVLELDDRARAIVYGMPSFIDMPN